MKKKHYEVDPIQSIGLLLALSRFRDRYVGKKVRGQLVDAVEFLADTLVPVCGPDRWWFRLGLVFNEPPNMVQDDDEPEEKMLKRVFSDIPTHASVQTHDLDLALRWMNGDVEIADDQWTLDDEWEMPEQ